METTYTSMGATEEHLSEAFPKGTKVELLSTVDGAWKSCSIQFQTDSGEEYSKRRQDIYLNHPRRNTPYWRVLMDTWSHACGTIEIEVGEIFGDVEIHNLRDAKRYAKELSDRLGWEWEDPK